MKINFGCGKRVKEGWLNVDAVSREDAAPDLIYKMEFDALGILVHKMPLGDACATDLMALHVIEHFHPWETWAVLGEWRRVLQHGGRLIIELPNIELAARNLLEGTPDQLSMWAFYGDGSHRDPYMMHKTGFTPRTITNILAARGFTNIEVLPPRTHMKRLDRDMRIEAVKA